MRLSELRTGEQGVIVKVYGHGGFRKRIVEMGFIKGKTVEVLLNAPLQDPVKYKVMGYEVSLRRHEAELIEIATSSLPTRESPLTLSPKGRLFPLMSQAQPTIMLSASAVPSMWHSSAIPTAARRRSSTSPAVPTHEWVTTAV